MQKAEEEHERLLQESLQEVYDDAFVSSPFEKSPPVKAYAGVCLEKIKSGLAQLTGFLAVLHLFLPCMEAADKFSTGPARSEGALASFYQLRISQTF